MGYATRAPPSTKVLDTAFKSKTRYRTYKSTNRFSKVAVRRTLHKKTKTTNNKPKQNLYTRQLPTSSSTQPPATSSCRTQLLPWIHQPFSSSTTPLVQNLLKPNSGAPMLETDSSIVNHHYKTSKLPAEIKQTRRSYVQKT